MNNLKLYGCILLILLCAHKVKAQSGWTCDPHDYQYDMTVYPTVEINGTAVADLSTYEVAAFVADECRGIAEVVTTLSSQQYLYLRIRSNDSSGETITFKAYNTATQEVITLETDDPVTFLSNDAIGTPSAPITLKQESFVPGDVNGDGKINSVDLSLLIGKILGKSNPLFIDAAGDLDQNEKYNSVDLSLLIKLILK